MTAPDGYLSNRMTPTELRSKGEQHGRGWQTRLAHGLQVDPRTVRRWLAGKARITPQMEMLINQWMANAKPKHTP